MSENQGCRVDRCTNMPKFEVDADDSLLLVCRNHLSKAIEEAATDKAVLVGLHPISDVAYLRTENKRLRRELRELRGESA